jgi:ABC-type multidrug transport system fused ATPase/permease subunit
MSEFLGSFIVIFILLLGGQMVLNTDKNFTAEMFITYIVLFTQIINPAKTISEATANFKKGFASLHRIEEITLSDEKKSLNNPTPNLFLHLMKAFVLTTFVLHMKIKPYSTTSIWLFPKEKPLPFAEVQELENQPLSTFFPVFTM